MDTQVEQSFDSRDELIEKLHEYAITEGFVLTVGRSNKDCNVKLHCDRAGSLKMVIEDIPVENTGKALLG